MPRAVRPLLSRRAAALATAAAVLALAAPPAAAGGGADVVAYQPPVVAAMVDGFRPPASPYGAGNRGVDFATRSGEPVGAAAPGIVAFAGQVGGSLHVTVLHADGIRTSYSFLDGVAVRRGQRVAAGATVGWAGTRLHWGARAGDTYVDPLLLLGGTGDGATRARLVPDDEHDRHPRSEAAERALVVALLRAVVRSGAVAARLGPGAPAWARGLPLDRILTELGRLALHDPALAAFVAAAEQLTSADWWEIARLVRRLADDDEPCTPASVSPPRPEGRRLAVLVGGLGSSSASAAVTEVDTRGLGYQPGDVHQFSYLGGTAAEHPYDAHATVGDLPAAGARLGQLLARLAAEHPGVPIDVIAHSQGGIVARLALASVPAPEATPAPGDGGPLASAPPVATLVTLGSPHQGADLANAVLATRKVLVGRVVQDVAAAAGVVPVPGSAPAVRQLAPGSAVLRGLDATPLPPGVHVVSVAARADVVVPSPRTRLPGARNVTVTVDGLHDHGELPGSPKASREIALAVHRMPPTCRSAADAVLDVATGRLVMAAEQGATFYVAARLGAGRLPR